MAKYEPDLYRDKPGYAKLDAEQKAVADKWDKEKLERAVLLDEMGRAESTKDHHKAKEIFKKLVAADGDMCEHERSIWSNCSACLDIENICNKGSANEEDW